MKRQAFIRDHQRIGHWRSSWISHKGKKEQPNCHFSTEYLEKWEMNEDVKCQRFYPTGRSRDFWFVLLFESSPEFSENISSRSENWTRSLDTYHHHDKLTDNLIEVIINIIYHWMNPFFLLTSQSPLNHWLCLDRYSC